MRKFKILQSKMNEYCQKQEELLDMKFQLKLLKREIEYKKQLLGYMRENIDETINDYQEEKLYKQAQDIFQKETDS